LAYGKTTDCNLILFYKDSAYEFQYTVYTLSEIYVDGQVITPTIQKYKAHFVSLGQAFDQELLLLHNVCDTELINLYSKVLAYDFASDKWHIIE